MSDWMEDPKAQKWAKRVLDDLVPKIEMSSVTVSLVPRGDPDIKFAVELGLMIMMDKPIIAVVQPGVRVPAKLIAVADEIVEYAPDDPEPLARAIRRVMSK